MCAISMTDIILRNEQDVRDFVVGCTFFGTGGGGRPEHGMNLLVDDLNRLGEIRISDPADIRDDAWVCTPFLMGSIAPETAEILARRASLGLGRRIAMAERITTLAVLELERYAHVDIEGIVPEELGGYSTPGAVDVGLALGKKIVNGDYTGRATPEIYLTTYLAGRPSYPVTYADEWGNVTIIKHSVNFFVAEALGKMISVAVRGGIAGAGHLMRGKEMKEVILRNTLSECYLVGQTIRNAIARKKDAASSIAETMNGWVLFRGRVTKKDWQDREGYMWGTNTIEGHEEFKGHVFKIFYKNENHITWLDNKPYVTSPDIIEVIRETGEPITNTDIKEGDVVSIVGLRGREPFKTPKGVDAHGPKHFGYDFPYVRIERVMQEGRNDL
jgi:DUF917 family protein